MADLLTRAYYPDFDEQQITIERDRLCRIASDPTAGDRTAVRRWRADDFIEAFRKTYDEGDLKEYVDGMALGFNPLPSDPRWMYYESDQVALQSDWQCVRSDLSRVWSTFYNLHSCLEHQADDEVSRPEDGEPASNERSDAAQSAAGGDHTSGT